MEPEDKEHSFSQAIPPYLSRWPPIVDDLSTATSELQARTIEECLTLLTAVNDPFNDPFDFDEDGLPYLRKQDHFAFITDGLGQLPAQFVLMDASRPWLMYWSMLSLYVMGYDVEQYRASIIKTFTPLQNGSGGFGGGQGHLSHLACTYATLLAIATIGGSEVYNLIDRPALYRWLGQLKDRSGGFRVCEDGEIDVRGAYCALVAITLLDLPWKLPDDSPAAACGFTDFRDGLGTYLSRCQTYEGGICANPSNEAHGSYTFCVLGCLSILGEPAETITKYLDLQSLIRWLSSRQYAPEGGFAGRTNKVVDGCYSHWIGGCWPLIEAAIDGPLERSQESRICRRLFSADGLMRYILSCCQAPSGGLRDKPSKRPDAYHTCYNLAGLSMATHRHSYSSKHRSPTGAPIWQPQKDETSLAVSAEDGNGQSNMDLPMALQPVYVVPHEAVINFQTWSKSNPVSYH